jgi:hypothetical protein
LFPANKVVPRKSRRRTPNAFQIRNVGRWRSDIFAGQGNSLTDVCPKGVEKALAANYQPWLRVQDVPSKGRIHRIKGCITGRVHHLLSDLEAKVFYTFDYSLSAVAFASNSHYYLWKRLWPSLKNAA